MLETQVEYAKRRKVSPRTIAKWIKRGLVVREYGKVHVEKSDERLKMYHRTEGIPLARLRHEVPEPSTVTIEIDWLADSLERLLDRVYSEMSAAWKEKRGLAPIEITTIIAEERDAILNALED